MNRALMALACSVALTACSLEPKFDRPPPAIPTSWPAGAAYGPATDAALPALGYRDIFRDPRLLGIIEQALANNQDLRIAIANVAAARAQSRVTRAQIFPGLDVSGGTATSNSGNDGKGSRTSYDADAGLSAFEIDLFGRVRNLSKAAQQDYLASEATARAVRLTLVAEIARTYLTLAADRSLLRIAEETQANATRSFTLTQARLRGGIAPRTDLRQAETILAEARSDRANQTTLVAQDRNALELLVGAPLRDDQLPAILADVEGLLTELPAGLDSRILLRRPDVVAAEYDLRAANARIGAARAAFFPTISLTAIAGFASNALSSLFDAGAFSWTVEPSARLSIFDGGANRGNLAFANAQRERMLAAYQKSIQTAFREVADALARRGTIAEQLAAQHQLEAASRDNYGLADARYREGISSFLDSLVAQRTLYAAQRSLVATQLVRADNLVELYRALGGDMLADAPPPSRPRD